MEYKLEKIKRLARVLKKDISVEAIDLFYSLAELDTSYLSLLHHPKVHIMIDLVNIVTRDGRHDAKIRVRAKRWLRSKGVEVSATIDNGDLVAYIKLWKLAEKLEREKHEVCLSRM